MCAEKYVRSTHTHTALAALIVYDTWGRLEKAWEEQLQTPTPSHPEISSALNTRATWSLIVDQVNNSLGRLFQGFLNNDVPKLEEHADAKLCASTCLPS